MQFWLSPNLHKPLSVKLNKKTKNMKSKILLILIVLINNLNLFSQINYSVKEINLNELGKNYFSEDLIISDNLNVIWSNENKIFINSIDDGSVINEIDLPVTDFAIYHQNKILVLGKDKKIYLIENYAENQPKIQEISIKDEFLPLGIKIAGENVLLYNKTQILISELKNKNIELGEIIDIQETNFCTNTNYIAFINAEKVNIYSLIDKKITHSFVPEINDIEKGMIEKYIEFTPSSYISKMVFADNDRLLLYILGSCHLKTYSISNFLETTIFRYKYYTWPVDDIDVIVLDKFVVTNRTSGGMFPSNKIMTIFSKSDILKQPSYPYPSSLKVFQEF